MISPILTPVVRPITKGAVKALGASRFMTKLDRERKSYIALNQDIILPHDKEWSLTTEMVIPTSGTYIMADRDSTRGHDRAGFTADGRVFLPTEYSEPVGGSYEGDKGVLTLHKVEVLNNSSGNVAIKVNDETSYFRPNGSLRPVIDSIGAQYSGSTGVPFHEGHILNIKLVVDGELIIDMPLDGNYSAENNTVINLASGIHGTLVNAESGDSTLFTLEGNRWTDTEGKTLDVGY